MIWSSDMPTACMRAIFSLAGLEKPHSSMLQVATESLQPWHWHCIWAPTRRTSVDGFSAAVWAKIAALRRKKARSKGWTRLARGRLPACPAKASNLAHIVLNSGITRDLCALHLADDLGAGVLHFDFARDEAD